MTELTMNQVLSDLQGFTLKTYLNKVKTQEINRLFWIFTKDKRVPVHLFQNNI